MNTPLGIYIGLSIVVGLVLGGFCRRQCKSWWWGIVAALFYTLAWPLVLPWSIGELIGEPTSGKKRKCQRESIGQASQ